MSAASAITRGGLIALCEDGIRPESKWHNRDSARSQRKLGEAWALLRAGCNFTVLTEGALKSDKKTIWIEITSKGFNYVEMGALYEDVDTFYIPTRARLEQVGEGDWY